MPGQSAKEPDISENEQAKTLTPEERLFRAVFSKSATGVVRPTLSNADVENDAASNGRPSIETLRREAAGEAWLVANSAVVSALPRGTVVALNVETGAYVTAESSVEAMDKFEATFGLSAWAWVHEIDVPIKLGGGLWALSSGA